MCVAVGKRAWASVHGRVCKSARVQECKSASVQACKSASVRHRYNRSCGIAICPRELSARNNETGKVFTGGLRPPRHEDTKTRRHVRTRGGRLGSFHAQRLSNECPERVPGTGARRVVRSDSIHGAGPRTRLDFRVVGVVHGCIVSIFPVVSLCTTPPCHCARRFNKFSQPMSKGPGLWPTGQ